MHKDPWHRHLAELNKAKAEREAVYGRDIMPFAGRHHARYFRPDVPYHIISRVFQGRFLLRPGARLNSVIAGVIGRA